MFYHCTNFKYADRFLDTNVLFIPEIDKTIRRDTIYYHHDAYVYIEVESNREIFCESFRHYAFHPISICLSIFPPMFLYNDADGIYYYHVFIQGKHYAICHRYNVFKNAKRINISDEKGKFVCLCAGFEVDDFEGKDEWLKAYEEYYKNTVFNTAKLYCYIQ